MIYGTDTTTGRVVGMMAGIPLQPAGIPAPRYTGVDYYAGVRSATVARSRARVDAYLAHARVAEHEAIARQLVPRYYFVLKSAASVYLVRARNSRQAGQLLTETVGTAATVTSRVQISQESAFVMIDLNCNAAFARATVSFLATNSVFTGVIVQEQVVETGTLVMI
ncbi:hypothetical protein [Lacticaseibacillus pantheris]|nr:hypothetical protein [Lacticaseibacillus pantheris]